MSGGPWLAQPVLGGKALQTRGRAPVVRQREADTRRTLDALERDRRARLGLPVDGRVRLDPAGGRLEGEIPW